MLKVNIKGGEIRGVDGRVFQLSDFNAHEEVIEFGPHGIRLPRQLAGVFRIYEGWYFAYTTRAVTDMSDVDTRCEVQLRINDLVLAQATLTSLLCRSWPVETALYERGRFPTAFLVGNNDDVEIRVIHGPFPLYAHLYGRRHQVIQ